MPEMPRAFYFYIITLVANPCIVCHNSAVNAKDVKTIELLEKMHPDAECELHFGSPFELLVAVILSAQCTDKRVNEVTKHLFKRANTPRGIVEMPLEELEKEIFSCGFYHSKARALKEMSAAVLERGGVPETREELMKLRGVGRKTANVVPEKTEEQLEARFDESLWSRLHHLLIFHGRYTCHSQKPDCAACLLKEECKYYNKTQKV